MKLVKDTDGVVQKKAKVPPEKHTFDAEFRGYVNLVLSDEEKGLWRTWATTDAPWLVLNDQIRRGVNVSVKQDPKGANALASATQRDPLSPNAGLVVTARAADAEQALSRVLFCLAVLDRTEKWEDTQPIADPDRW